MVGCFHLRSVSLLNITIDPANALWELGTSTLETQHEPLRLRTPDEGIICLLMTKPGSKEYLTPCVCNLDLKLTSEKERVASEPLFISTSPNIAAAPFARLGQASHLLGHVFTHINDRSLSPPVRLEEARQLIRAILALRSFLQPEIASEATKICVPIAVCYRSVSSELQFVKRCTEHCSALTLLYEHCTGVGATLVPEEKELQEMGATGLDNLVSEVISYAGHIQTIIAFYMDQASPLITTCLYKTAKRLIGLLNPDSLVALTFIKETLEKLSMRWSVAGKLRA